MTGVSVVLQLAINPLNPSTLYAGTDKGVFRSTDGGITWNAINTGLTSGGAVPIIDALVIDPSNPSILYAGDGDGSGVFKSIDGGSSWSRFISGLNSTRILSLAIDPGNPTTVFAGTAHFGVNKSIDGGATWIPFNNGSPLAGENVSAFAFNPSNSAIIYVATSGGIFKTVNGGTSWSLVNGNLPLGISTDSVAIDPSNTAILYLGTDRGVYQSRDGGTTWNLAPGIPTPIWTNSVVIDTTNPSVVYAATNGRGVFKSIDGGTSWQPTGANSGNGVSPATSIAKVSGDNQTASAGAALARPLVVVVTNAFGIPVPGVSVTFAVTKGGGILSAPATVTTDAQGVASSILTTGAAGPQTVIATATGLAGSPVTFNATATPGQCTTNCGCTIPSQCFDTPKQILIVPPVLNFTVVAASDLPPSQPFTFNVTPTGTVNWGAGVTYGVASSEADSSASNWLSLSPASGTQAASATVAVNITNTSLVPGIYTATITISAPSVTPGSVAVNYVVTPQPTFILTPTSLVFTGKSGVNPPSQDVKVESDNASAMDWTATPVTTSGGNWLKISRSAGRTPSTITVSTDTTGLIAGEYNGTIEIAAPGAKSQFFQVKLKVDGLSLSCNVPNGPPVIGVSYLLTCKVTSGQTPYNWSISGPLPIGLSPSGTTGDSITIGGTPTKDAAGDYNFTVTVTDGSTPTLQSASQSIKFTIKPPADPLVISPASLPNGAVNVVYPVITFDATGGKVPYSWTAVGLPPGLTLSSGGVLSGTSISAGTYDVIFTVIDSSPTPLKGSSKISLRINAPPAVLLTVSPIQLNFTYQQGDPIQPVPQGVGVFTNPTGASFSVAVLTSDGGTWLKVSSGPDQESFTPGNVSVSVDTTGLQPETTYRGQITITSPGSAPPSTLVSVTLTVTRRKPPKLSVSSLIQTYTLVQGSEPVQGQVIVSNVGGGGLQFRSQATSDGNWLTLTGSSGGVATPSASASVGFVVNPSPLRVPGPYRGAITITDAESGDQTKVDITLVLNVTEQKSIKLSQAGMTFRAVEKGPKPLTQSLAVFNLGQGSMQWTSQAETIPAGQKWLSVVTGGTGNSTPGNPGEVEISVDQSGLLPGLYYGTILVTSSDAVNKSQRVSVLLNVVSAGQLGSEPGVSTGGIILVGTPGSTLAVQQDVSLFNPSGKALAYSSSLFTTDGGKWLNVKSGNGTLSATGTGTITVQANLVGVSEGVLNGTVEVAFSDGTVATIKVLLVATNGSVATTSGDGKGDSTRLIPGATATCSRDKLVPVFELPTPSQRLQVAQSQQLRVRILDECGSPMTASSRSVADVRFSNQDIAVKLADRGNGIWEGTWTPVTAQPQVTLEGFAWIPPAATLGIGPIGRSTIQVQVLPANTNSAAQPRGVLNAASYDLSNQGLVVPGSYVAVFGDRLADGTEQPGDVPLPDSCGNAKLLLGEFSLLVSFCSPEQVNGLVPQVLNTNAEYQLIVQRGDTQSTGVPVTVTDLQPGIFTTSQTGQGQGAVLISGTSIIAGPNRIRSRPVKRGEFVEIYSSGLGSVIGDGGENPPKDGNAANASGKPLYKTVAKATVTIGGKDYDVAFAGLAPGFVALYQVNVQIPVDAPTGDAVPVVLTMSASNGQRVSSQTVTIAIQ